MRALALDVGSKTIGIAITDEAEIAAHPHAVLARSGNTPDASAIAALVVQHAITHLVIGMPFELSGRIGHRARRVKLFITALRAAIPTTVEFAEQDERFTTAAAERVLIEADLSRERRREVIDRQAAVLILQSWLATRARP